VRAVIHIGAEKTGTTTLQRCFAENSGALSAAGIHYPRSISGNQHWALALYAMDQDRTTLLGDRASAYLDDRDAWRERLVGRLAGELDALTGVDTLLLSAEHLSSQLLSTAEIARLRALLDRWCDDYTVVLYLRRQDRARISLYSSELRAGGSDPEILGPVAHSEIGFDYERMLELWASGFGVDAIVPRVFDRVQRGPTDLLGDFVHGARLRLDGAGLHLAEETNVALSADAQQLLLEFNRVSGSPFGNPALLRARRLVAQEAATHFPGSPRRPSRDQARQYLQQFAEANARVAARWFGGELFDHDFAEFPDVADRVPQLDPTEVLTVMARVAERLAADQPPAGRRRRRRGGPVAQTTSSTPPGGEPRTLARARRWLRCVGQRSGTNR
jgi:hypothetical protein